MKRITLTIPSGNEIPYEAANFPGGEVRVRINSSQPAIGPEVFIRAVLLNSNDVMTLSMIADALRRLGVLKIHLEMPYTPYARQDRVCNPGEAFALEVFGEMINGMGFSSIEIWDPHSKVTRDVIWRANAIPCYMLMRQNREVHDWMYRTIWSGVPIYLVCPDKGARGRVEEVADHFSVHGVIYADKVRNPENGQIIRTEILNPPDNIDRSKLLIVDDICDGGRTFIELAKVLRPFNPVELNLYVTHGIFSQGLEVLLNKKSEPAPVEGQYRVEHTGEFDNVWCALNFKDYQ